VFFITNIIYAQPVVTTYK